MPEDAEPAPAIINKKIEASIDNICLKLRLDENVKKYCIELSQYLQPIQGGKGQHEIPDALANAVACALVSLAHEELWRKNRIPKHLPDKIIGGLYGLRSAAVVYNKRLINSEIMKNKKAHQEEGKHVKRTLR